MVSLTISWGPGALRGLSRAAGRRWNALCHVTQLQLLFPSLEYSSSLNSHVLLTSSPRVLLKCHLLRELFSALLCLHHHPNLAPPISSYSRSSAGNSSLPGVKSIRVFACLSIACLLYSALEPKFQKWQEFFLVQHYSPSVNKNKNWHVIGTNKYLFMDTWVYWDSI